MKKMVGCIAKSPCILSSRWYYRSSSISGKFLIFTAPKNRGLYCMLSISNCFVIFTVPQRCREKGGLSSPPRPDTFNEAPAISRVSPQHLYRLSLPIILWYHTVTPYYDTSRLPSYSCLQLLT